MEVQFSGSRFFEEEIRKTSFESFLGHSLLFLNVQKFKRETAKKFVAIEGLEVNKDLPSGVTVLVSEREPVASLVALTEPVEASLSAFVSELARQAPSAGGEGFLVDKEGLVFTRGRSEGVPLIILEAHSGEAAQGRIIEGTAKKLLSFLLSLSFREIKPLVLSTHRGDFLFILPEHIVVLGTAEKTAEDQAEILKIVLEKYRIEGKRLLKIDLRFKNPVVEFE